MILERIKKKSFLVLTMLLGIIIQSCGSECDEFADGTNVAINVPATGYEAVLESSEFKEFDSKYTSFMAVIGEVTSRMTQEQKEELLKLSNLYMSDPERYNDLFTYEVANVFNNDLIRAKERLSSLLEAQKYLVKNKKLSQNIKGNEKLILAELQVNRDINSKVMNNFTPIVKTRREIDDLDKLRECKSLCKESYDNTTDALDTAYLCETAFNVLACVLSSGADIAPAVVIQLGLTEALYIQRDLAVKDYDICIRNCELSWKH